MSDKLVSMRMSEDVHRAIVEYAKRRGLRTATGVNFSAATRELLEIALRLLEAGDE
jgi:hypothetical protein